LLQLNNLVRQILYRRPGPIRLKTVLALLRELAAVPCKLPDAPMLVPAGCLLGWQCAPHNPNARDSSESTARRGLDRSRV